MNSIIADVFTNTRSYFIYFPDSIQFPNYIDRWNSYADQVEHGEVFKDDCDSFAMTCCDLLVRRGMNPEKVRLAFCYTELGDGHLVCIADTYLLDNRQRIIWHWDEVFYKWVSSMKMSDRIWRTMI